MQKQKENENLPRPISMSETESEGKIIKKNVNIIQDFSNYDQCVNCVVLIVI